MIIKTLGNQSVKIEFEELYVKPFYKTNGAYYCLCSNLGNKEIKIAEYSNKKLAKTMKCIIHLHRFLEKPIQILNECDVEKWLEGTERLLRAVKAQ